MKFCYIDFEYNCSQEAFLNLVCASLKLSDCSKIKSYWLLGEVENKENLKTELLEISKNYTFVAFNVIAEGRSFLSLGIDPTSVKWIDLQAEYKLLINGNYTFAYGPQLINNNPVYTYPPSLRPFINSSEASGKRFDRPQKSLASSCYKLLNKLIDTKTKDSMRDLILENKEFYFPIERQNIIKYCESDIIVLPELHEKINAELKYTSLEGQLYRAKAVAHHALMENEGYPINYNQLKKFSDSHLLIMNQLKRQINELFPHIAPFKWVSRAGTYTLSTKKVKEWISQNHRDTWPKTPTNEYSLKLDNWQDHYSPRHFYKKDCFGEQMVRYLKIRSSLNGLQKGKKKVSFWDYVGSDSRVRPYLNPYGSQTARTQPKSTSLLFLRPAWQRALVYPKRGKTLGTIDYSSCEFLIAALLSKCPSMVKAYKSGDIYLYFAKQIGLVPRNGTKESHKKERDLCKVIILGVLYGLTKVGLSKELSKILNEDVTEEYAQEFIDQFFETFIEYKYFREDTIDKYYQEKHLKLEDHWVLYGDLKNERSVQNFLVQGMGSTILRRAIFKAHNKGLKVLFPLHDAIFIEFDSVNERAMEHLYDAMFDAFVESFPTQKKDASLIRLDGHIWGPKYVKDQYVELKQFNVLATNQYIDERAIEEYNEFKPFLNNYTNTHI